MLESMFGALFVVMTITLIVYWLTCLVAWDGEERCDESQCSSCPFPCEKHGSRNEEENQKWKTF